MADPTLPAKTDDPPINTPFYMDKALWVVLLAPVLAFLNSRFNLGLKAEEIVGIVFPVVAYIVMHKWKTGTLQKATIAADAAVAAAKNEDPAIGLAKP